MKTLSLTILSILLTVKATCFAVEANQKVKLETYKDAILWIGYEMPDEFDSSTLKDEAANKKAIEAGLQKCEEYALDGNLLYMGALAGYYYNSEKDTKKGLYWAHKASLKGSSDAMIILWDAYRSGNGVVRDYEECGKWLYLASAKGHKQARARVQELENDDPNDYYGKVRKKARDWQEAHPEAFFSLD